MKKDLRSKTCCFTGHRKITGITTKELEKRLEEEIIKLINRRVIFFGFGASIGYDQIEASVVLRLREKYNKIKLIAVIPCEN